jgi:acetamidase/formamidase
VYVEGAQPDDVLQVDVLSIDLPLDYGYNGCNGFLPDNCDQALPAKIIALDRESMTAEFLPGIVIPLRDRSSAAWASHRAPDAGRVSSNPPGRHAGNLDNRELVAGSTLYIPVFVPGALFEVATVMPRRAMAKWIKPRSKRRCAAPALTVRKDMKLAWPRAETPTDYISMATDPDLTIATRGAIQEMIDFLVAEKHLTRHQAYSW